MTNKKKYINICFIVIFCLCITLPLLFCNKKSGIISVTENRVLTKFPSLYREEALNKSFLTDLESWINDNIGGRTVASKLATSSDYYLFNLSSKSDTYLGKEDWLYYYNDDILNDIQRLDIPTDEEINEYVEKMKAINDYIISKNVPFIGILAQDKKTIYPEYYREGIHPTNDSPSKNEIIVSAYQENGIDFISLHDTLMEGKKLGYMYPANGDNAHWNNYGAFLGYQRTMEQISNYVDVSILTEQDFNITPYISDTVFNTVIPMKETAYSFEYIGPQMDCYADTSFFDHISELEYNGNPDEYKLRYVNNSIPEAPKLLFVGDSYSTLMMHFFPYSFSEVTFLHTFDKQAIPQVIDMMEPDIVVYEYVERMQPYYNSKHDQFLEKAKEYNKSAL